jgi:hypothetical protein
MTGNGGGYCLMSMSDAPGEAATGFAGLAGRSVTFCNDPRKMDIVLLQDRLRKVQAMLHRMKLRVADLETGRDKS